MQERKQRQHDSLVTAPQQPHCQLHIHEPVDVSSSVNELLKSAAEKRRAKQRQLHGSSSNTSRISSWSGVSGSGGRPRSGAGGRNRN